MTVGSLILISCDEEIPQTFGDTPRVGISLDTANTKPKEIQDEEMEIITVGLIAEGEVILEDWKGEIQDPNEPRTILDKMPEFPGGIESFYQFFSNNLHYPRQAKRMGIEGRVYIEFVVDVTGETSDVRVVKGIFDILDQEAVRAFKELPKWIPGKENGFPVPVKMVMPVYFRLD